jgi:hypothetical protein
VGRNRPAKTEAPAGREQPRKFWQTAASPGIPAQATVGLGQERTQVSAQGKRRCQNIAAAERRNRRFLRASDERRRGVVAIPLVCGETAMNIIASLFVALSVISGVAASANAFNAKRLYAQHDRHAS